MSNNVTFNCSIYTFLESLAALATLSLPVAADQLQCTGPDELQAKAKGLSLRTFTITPGSRGQCILGKVAQQGYAAQLCGWVLLESPKHRLKQASAGHDCILSYKVFIQDASHC